MAPTELQVRLVNLMQEIDRVAGTSHPSHMEGMTDGQVLVLSLLAIARATFRGIIFLLREDHSEQARILGRTLLEDCTKLRYFERNADRLEEMRAKFDLASVYEERKLLEEALKHGSHPGEGDEELQALDEQENVLKGELDAMGSSPKALRKINQLLDDLDESEGYYLFRFASHTVHTSRVALETVKRRNEDGTVAIDFGGTPERVIGVGVNAAQLFVHGHLAAVRLLQWKTIPDVEAFTRKVIPSLEEIGAAYREARTGED